MERNYIAFISYRHMPLDIAVAKSVHTLIEQYRIPKSLRTNGKKRLGIVFRDQDELPVSSDLSEDIRSALDHSEYLIVVCTPDTPLSIWVEREINYFLKHHSRHHIFTVLASGEPLDAFPPALTHYYDEASGTEQDIEPLAVDIRAKDTRSTLSKLRREVKRLFAAMIGCPYDALILREQKRQRRRTLTAAAAILLVTLSFSSVLLVKNRQIDRQNTQLESVNQQLESINLELEDKNTELARQKADALRREALLLTADAQTALENGDYVSAIRNAVAALPKEGSEDLPYHAPAERILFSALNVFDSRDSSALIASTVLEQTTPVSDFATTKDGTRLVTIDPFGVLNCFSTLTSDLVWSTVISGIEYSSLNPPEQLFPCPSQNSVIAFHSDRLTAYSFDSGEELWAADLSSAVDDCLVHSAEHDMLAYIDRRSTEDFSSYIYSLVVLSAQSGETRCRIPIVSTESYSGFDFSSSSSSPSANGVFSDDGALFAGTFRDGTSTEETTVSYYVADLTKETSKICFEQSVPLPYYSIPPLGMEFRDSNDTLLVIRESGDYSTAAILEKVDVKNGSLLWQAGTTSDEHGAFTSGTDCVLFYPSRVLIGSNDRLYQFDSDTGEFLASAELHDSIIELRQVANGFFGFVLANGYQAIGWSNASGLHDSAFFSASVTYEPVAQAAFWSDSFIAGTVEDGSISGIAVGGDDISGYTAVVPADDNHTVVIKRALSAPRRTMTGIPLPEGARMSSPNAVFCTDGTIVFGPFYSFDSDSNDYTDFYAAVDPSVHQVKHLFGLEGYFDEENIYFLPDASGYINCDENGNISLFTIKSGKTAILSDSASAFVTEGTQTKYIWDSFCSASARLSATQEILSARCDGDTLDVWRNGSDPVEIPLPAELRITLQDRDYYKRLVKVGANGTILLSHHIYEHTQTLSDFTVYDTEGNEWYSFRGDAAFPNNSAIAIAASKQWFAAVDADNLIRIFNIETGGEVSTFSLQMPASSVFQMDFLLDDQYLLVKTGDLQLLIFNCTSGEIVFRQQLECYSDSRIHAYTDTENQRLYLSANSTLSPNGICLDLRSWTKLSDMKRFLCYDDQNNEIYHYSYEEPLLFGTVPDTAELIAYGMQVIEQSECKE